MHRTQVTSRLPNLTFGLLISLLFTVIACGSAKVSVVSNRVQATGEKASQDAKKDTNELLKDLIIAQDENGLPTAVKGLQTNMQGSSDKSTQVTSKIVDLAPATNLEEKLFTFNIPSGMKASYSTPFSADSGYTDIPAEVLCAKATYHDHEPTMQEVFEFAQAKKVCGSIAVGFCIRAVPTTPERTETGYLKTPALHLNILCPNTSFANLTFRLDGVNELRPELARVTAKAASEVTGLYVTNDPDCASGGSWKTFAKEIAFDWTLQQNPYQPRVYGQFVNVLGEKSGCLSAALPLDPNQAPSLRIESFSHVQDSTYDTEVVFGPSLATAMLLSDSPTCSGGTWQPFVLRSSRRIEARDQTLSVYAKLREASGQESVCLNASLPIDVSAPTGTGLVINGGQAYTRSPLVTLGLSSNNATTMYITNTAGCAAGGSWEAFAPSKNWTLATTNAEARVYAKYKTRGGGQSDCLSASIIHDGLAPTGAGLVIDGGRPYTTSLSVVLTPAAIGASEMLITNTADCRQGNWEAFAASKPWTLGLSNAAAQVYAKYRDLAGNETACVSASIVHDTDGPGPSSLTINGGASYTNNLGVTLNLASSGASERYLTTSAGCAAGGSWQAMAASVPWTLSSPNAVNTVYVQYRDAAGNTSSCLTASITHDNQGPTGVSLVIAGGQVYTTTDAVSVSLGATGASEVYLTNAAGCNAGGAWLAYATSRPWTLGQTNALATVYGKFRDEAGNESACLNDTITHDSLPPTGIGVSINAGAVYTTSASVSLSLAATGASHMLINNSADCSGAGNWEAYAANRAWNLGVGAPMSSPMVSGSLAVEAPMSSSMVSVKYRDQAGNESACTSDGIIFDNEAPSAPSLQINADAPYTNSPTATVSLNTSAVGASEMYVTNTPGCGANGTWEPYSTLKSNWNLAQTNATATVYTAYRDAAGNLSSCVADTIVHDNIPPTAPASMSAHPYARGPAHSAWMWWGASTDGGSGLATYEVGVSTVGGSPWSWLPWGSTGASVVYSGGYAVFSVGQNYYGSVRAKDRAGNISTIAASSAFTLGWYQEAYIKAGNADAGDLFGKLVAISGDTVAVSAPQEDSAQTTIQAGAPGATNDNASNAGGVYIYKRTSNGSYDRGSTGVTWAAEAFVKAANNRSNLEFGQSLALDGDTLAVSSEKDVSNQATITNGPLAANDGTSAPYGAAWVYKRAGTTWAQEAYIKRSGNDASFQYGHLVALKGDRLAVAAPHDDAVSAGAGAVHAYTRVGNSWALEGVVGDLAPQTNAYFGKSLAMSSDTLVVGSPGEGSADTAITNGAWSASTPSGTPGAVLVYRRSGLGWLAEARIKTANHDSSDQVGDGNAVALDGDTIAIGAYREDSGQSTVTNGTGTAGTNNTQPDSGAVYVYKRNGTIWAQEAYIKASSVDAGDLFGRSVALAGNVLVVGAPGEDSGRNAIVNNAPPSADNEASNSGAVYVFTRSGTTWAQSGLLKAHFSTPMSEANFGQSVAISQKTIIVGAPNDYQAVTTINNGHTSPFNALLTPESDTGGAFIFRYP